MKINPNPQKNLFQRTAEAFETPAKIAAGIALGVTGFADNALAQEVSDITDRPPHVLKLSKSPESILDELEITDLEKPKTTLVSKTSTTASEAYETRLDSIIANATKAGVLKDVDDFPAVMVFDFATGETVTRPNVKAHQDYVEDLKGRARKAFPDSPYGLNEILTFLHGFANGGNSSRAAPFIKPNQVKGLTNTILSVNQDLSKLNRDLGHVSYEHVNGNISNALKDLNDLQNGRQIFYIAKND